jgi:hypothetical protein
LSDLPALLCTDDFEDAEAEVTTAHSYATVQLPAAEPRTRPTGGLSIPKCTAVTSVTGRAEVSGTPTTAQSAWLALGSRGAAALLSECELPTREELPFALEQVFATLCRRAYRNGLVRAGVAHARALALTYIGFYQPPGLDFIGREVGAAVDEASTDHLADPLRPPAGARLAWGGADGRPILLDRVTHTHLGGMVRSRWMGPQIAADLTLGARLSGEAFAGVRVFAPKAIFRSTHVLPDGSSHDLDGCPLCAMNGAWT